MKVEAGFTNGLDSTNGSHLLLGRLVELLFCNEDIGSELDLQRSVRLSSKSYEVNVPNIQ